MNIKKCDRCGHIEEAEPLRLRVDNPAAVMKELNELIKNAVAILTRGPAPVYKLSIDEKELDLCDDCQKKLRDWFENPEENRDFVEKGFFRSWDNIGKKPSIPEDDEKEEEDEQ
jgi:hypothetical protein